jgi:hypothetical protein
MPSLDLDGQKVVHRGLGAVQVFSKVESEKLKSKDHTAKTGRLSSSVFLSQPEARIAVPSTASGSLFIFPAFYYKSGNT